jgi:hypothetical protein
MMHQWSRACGRGRGRSPCRVCARAGEGGRSGLLISLVFCEAHMRRPADLLKYLVEQAKKHEYSEKTVAAAMIQVCDDRRSRWFAGTLVRVRVQCVVAVHT